MCLDEIFERYNGGYAIEFTMWPDATLHIRGKNPHSTHYWKPIIRAIRRQALKEQLDVREPYYWGYGGGVGMRIHNRKDLRKLERLIEYMNGKRFNSIGRHIGRYW